MKVNRLVSKSMRRKEITPEQIANAFPVGTRAKVYDLINRMGDTKKTAYLLATTTFYTDQKRAVDILYGLLPKCHDFMDEFDFRAFYVAEKMKSQTRSRSNAPNKTASLAYEFEAAIEEFIEAYSPAERKPSAKKMTVALEDPNAEENDSEISELEETLGVQKIIRPIAIPLEK